MIANFWEKTEMFKIYLVHSISPLLNVTNILSATQTYHSDKRLISVDINKGKIIPPPPPLFCTKNVDFVPAVHPIRELLLFDCVQVECFPDYLESGSHFCCNPKAVAFFIDYTPLNFPQGSAAITDLWRSTMQSAFKFHV